MRLIAIGCSIAIGLGLFILPGSFLHHAGPRTPYAYLAATLLFLPIVLTYAERAAVIPGSGGACSLVRFSGPTWRTYLSGWIMIGGNLALIALLGWGAALYFNITIFRLLDISIDLHWLAPSMVILVALNDLIGTRGRWRLRVIAIYGGILFVLFLLARAWALPAAPLPTHPTPPPAESLNIIRIIALMSAGLWSINSILDKRDEMVNAERNMLPVLLVPIIISGVLGAAATYTYLQRIGTAANDTPPLIALALHVGFADEVILEAGYVSFGLVICLIALDKTLLIMVRLVGSMVRDGFFPEQFLRISPVLGTPLVALRLVAVLGVLIAAFVPRLILIGFVALMFLWTTALLNAPDILGVRSPLPRERKLKLPFYPLFPGMATSISLFLSLFLSVPVLLTGIGWGLAGLFFYVGYARRGAIDTRRRDSVVTNVLPERIKGQYTVLVSTANPDTAPSLIRTGALLARARGGRVLVLRVALLPDQVPQHMQRQSAEQQWLELNLITRRTGVKDIPLDILVRLAQSPKDGILGTAEEEKVNLLLLGWEGEHTHSDFEFDLDPVLDPVVRAAPCDVIIVRGTLPGSIHSILIPTEGSPNSLTAITCAQDIVRNVDTPHLVALNLIEEKMSEERLHQEKARLQAHIDRIGNTPPVDLLVLPTHDIKDGILHLAENFDMLLLGASRVGVLDQAIFGGLPVDVARAAPCPVLLVKHYEGAQRFWLRRAWEIISAPFPSLTVSERYEIYQQLYRAAHPSIDFFILIGLSATIAMLGLLQSSPAVIIGAMLVAPLMSPIISIALSIVQGSPRMLRTAAGSTLQGIVMAISVGAGITLISPTHPNTSEIVARTAPNVLDLLVALASGGAAGYAMGRKEVAAALPGVAIAAALVPPLAVVGYGTATAQLNIVGGSLLLFTTNLIAIIFAAALVFLLLGFRPLDTSQHRHVRLGFLLSMVALVIISIPLAVFSLDAVEEIARQEKVERVLQAEIESDDTRITDVVVQRQGNGFVTSVTLYSRTPFTEKQVVRIEQRLSEVVGAPVTLHATVLRAELLPDRGDVFVPTPTRGP